MCSKGIENVTGPAVDEGALLSHTRCVSLMSRVFWLSGDFTALKKKKDTWESPRSDDWIKTSASAIPAGMGRVDRSTVGKCPIRREWREKGKHERSCVIRPHESDVDEWREDWIVLEEVRRSWARHERGCKWSSLTEMSGIRWRGRRVIFKRSCFLHTVQTQLRWWKSVSQEKPRMHLRGDGEWRNYRKKNICNSSRELRRWGVHLGCLSRVLSRDNGCWKQTEVCLYGKHVTERWRTLVYKCKILRFNLTDVMNRMCFDVVSNRNWGLCSSSSQMIRVKMSWQFLSRMELIHQNSRE